MIAGILCYDKENQFTSGRIGPRTGYQLNTAKMAEWSAATPLAAPGIGEGEVQRRWDCAVQEIIAAHGRSPVGSETRGLTGYLLRSGWRAAHDEADNAVE